MYLYDSQRSRFHGIRNSGRWGGGDTDSEVGADDSISAYGDGDAG